MEGALDFGVVMAGCPRIAVMAEPCQALRALAGSPDRAEADLSEWTFTSRLSVVMRKKGDFR